MNPILHIEIPPTDIFNRRIVLNAPLVKVVCEEILSDLGQEFPENMFEVTFEEPNRFLLSEKFQRLTPYETASIGAVLRSYGYTVGGDDSDTHDVDARYIEA